jgi:hypothetical protein
VNNAELRNPSNQNDSTLSSVNETHANFRMIVLPKEFRRIVTADGNSVQTKVKRLSFSRTLNEFLGAVAPLTEVSSPHCLPSNLSCGASFPESASNGMTVGHCRLTLDAV